MVLGAAPNSVKTGGSGADTLTIIGSVTNATGGGDRLTLFVGANNVTVTGADTIVGGGGGDQIRGGVGR
ncbi:hypothetical protein [Roseomonas fluvialis]|uniref:Uncharacterized protein n=1 Tax=Roseomonas fluvialis TaxID=1750527 RepID=A0ABM7Y5N4_9PROT|nr:hypothetical protein [Roseomonas fluvialis]BDG73237.1 hypothetical protein Rmf_31660 [Roseomonas fluvialis]